MNAPPSRPMNEPAPPLQTDADAAATLNALRLLAAQPTLSQRQLSQALGLSLGKTHYVLHALMDKGLVKIENFSRSDNKLAYVYLLTPSGIRAKIALTREFLKRKVRQFESLQAEIDALRRETQSDDLARQRGASLTPTAAGAARRPGSSTDAPRGGSPDPESRA